MAEDNLSIDARKDEADVVRKQRTHSLFFGVSDTFKFIAGLFTATAMAMLLPSLTSATTGIGALGIGGALAAAPPVALGVLAVAALTTAVAIGSQYISSRTYQSANYNALEVNAKHTAKYLVKEIKGNNMCMTEHDNPARSDGKSWAEVTSAKRAQETQLHL